MRRTGGWKRLPRRTQRQPTWYVLQPLFIHSEISNTQQMREIAEIELAIQGGTEKIETLGEQGKVEESMREMAAIEALKSEKADKEVRKLILCCC